MNDLNKFITLLEQAFEKKAMLGRHEVALLSKLFVEGDYTGKQIGLAVV